MNQARCYRLTLRQHGKLLGHFETSVPDALPAAGHVAERFPAAEGYEVLWELAQAERRIIESSPDGLRLLGSQPLWLPLLAT